MICNRHGLITNNAEYGQSFCRRCFTEAIRKAEDILLERKLAAMRYANRPLDICALTHRNGCAHSAGRRLEDADALIRRLGGRT